MQTIEAPPAEAQPEGDPKAKRRPSRARRIAMRPRRAMVKVHRWLALILFAWFIVISITGAWLVVHHAVESWIHPDRYTATDGDVGAQAALDAGATALPEDAFVYGLTEPRNGRGVYLVYGEIAPPEGSPDTVFPSYATAYVDPGTGEVNGVQQDDEGATHWLYRGHEYLWQDYGLFGAFDPETGWCRPNADGHEPGGAKGVACDVLPDGMDMIGWFSLAFIVVLLTGFYLWYWPGVRRWATALVVKRGRGRFAFHLSLHRVVGLVFWVPLLIVAFTGAVFAFPNMNKWFENVTPAQRDFDLWVPAEEPVLEADGREPITPDEAVAIVEERYPERAINYVGLPFDETGSYQFWVTRGFDPWTREGGAGNVYVYIDQYTGETLYDGTPEDGNVFDQAWDDWNFPLHTGDFGGTVTARALGGGRPVPDHPRRHRPHDAARPPPQAQAPRQAANDGTGVPVAT